MTPLSGDNRAGINEAFNSTSRYLNDLLNIDHPYFEGMVNQMYPPEQQLNKASDTEAPFSDLHLSISNGFVSSKIYDKSLVMRKPAFRICVNKDANQLCGNREADQRLCFRYTDSTIPLLPRSEISSL